MLKEVCEEGIKEGMKKMNINLIKDKTITLEKGVEKLSISPQELKNR